jgi:Na+-transporting NADH:ubiquinone oxidoreductase subunit NqrC
MVNYEFDKLDCEMKTIFLITIFLLLCRVLAAPEFRTMLIEEAKKYDPYKRILSAISFVESRHNDNAINWGELSYGRYQIRSIRLQDYFERSGIRFNLVDMLDSVKSERVIRYYATRIGFRNEDEIILSWNCRSKKYLALVKSHLK